MDGDLSDLADLSDLSSLSDLTTLETLSVATNHVITEYLDRQYLYQLLNEVNK